MVQTMAFETKISFRIWLLISSTLAQSTVGNRCADPFVPVPVNTTCACPGDVLTFTCNIIGGGATVWSGTTLDCSGEIILRHDTFQPDVNNVCDGAVIETVGAKDNCYTSILNVTAGVGFNNTSARCLVQDAERREIGQSNVTIVLVSGLLQEPTGVRVSDVNMREIVFCWDPVNSFCSDSIDYKIISTHCGVCPATTNNSRAICSSPSIPGMCTFNIHSVVCGQTGAMSNSLILTLRRPNKPQVNAIIPVYSARTRSLIKSIIAIDQEPPFNITDDISGSVVSYSFNFSGTTSNMSACSDGIVRCDYSIDIPPSVCAASTGVSVTVSASNKLGQGPTSDPTTLGCSNRFVDVQYDSMTSAIICDFTDKLDMSVKSCSVKYGQSDQTLIYNAEANSTLERPNYITVKVDPKKFNYYSVTASNDNITIIVEGSLSRSTGTINATIAIAVIVPLGVLVIIIIVIVSVIAVVWLIRRKQKQGGLTSEHGMNALPWTAIEFHVPLDTKSYKPTIDGIKKQWKLKDVSTDRFRMFEFRRNYELKEFIEKEQQHEFKRGHAFYEFRDEFESIPEHKEVIFMHKKSSKFLSLEKISRDQFKGGRKEFDIFVQSTGSGVRCLEAGTALLYDIRTPTDAIPGTPLKMVLSDQLKVTRLQETQTIKKLREENRVPLNKDNMFVDCESYMLLKEKISVLDAILRDKKTGYFYSGPYARYMVDDYVEGIDVPDYNKWEVFVLCKFNEDMELLQGAQLLHQNPDSMSPEFYVLTVDEDNVQMAKFVESKGYMFENGCVFYEFTQKQDLQHYKEVVYMSEVKNEKQFYSSMDLFYAIPGTLDKKKENVEPGPKPKGVDKIFIQSTSHGTRCLKQGTKLLIKTDGQSKTNL